MKSIVLIASLIILILMVSSAYAADWPSQADVGGFRVTNIRGSLDTNGSGTATGMLQIPNLGNASISLTRSSGGDITGGTSIEARPVKGTFTLSNRGLSGRGSVDCSPRPIDDAAISINPRGQASGTGRMNLGRLILSVDFTASGASCSVSGATPVNARVDTAVASYKFDGRLSVQGDNGRASGTVSGKVERTSKLANQVTTFRIPNTSVDLANGRCTIDVSGVSLTFGLF